MPKSELFGILYGIYGFGASARCPKGILRAAGSAGAVRGAGSLSGAESSGTGAAALDHRKAFKTVPPAVCRKVGTVR